jgi:hypothetical protein
MSFCWAEWKIFAVECLKEAISIIVSQIDACDKDTSRKVLVRYHLLPEERYPKGSVLIKHLNSTLYSTDFK